MPEQAQPNALRNLIWSIPGGRTAFPEGNNGTINWGFGSGTTLADHAAGRTVLGAAGRGAIDPTGGMLLPGGEGGGIGGLMSGMFGGGRMPNFDSSNQRISNAAAGTGSVVARGFVGSGRMSGRAGLGPTYGGVTPQNGPQLSLEQFTGRNPNWSVATAGTGVGQGVEVDRSNQAETDTAMSDIAAQTRGTMGQQGSGRVGNPGGTGRYGGSTRLGAGALGSAGAQALADYQRALMSRGGTEAER